MKEKRKQTRHRTRAYCFVYDIQNNESLGCLVDISTKGLQIFGSKPIMVGPTYCLKIEMHEEFKGSRILPINAKCVWFKESDDEGFFISGFEFTNISKETEERINLFTQSTTFVTSNVE
jgi:hypothetical protein